MDRLSTLPTEVLDMICQVVQLHGLEHIKSLRLCNRLLEVIASGYLIPCLQVGLRKRLLRRIQWVAARPKFARGVKELEVDVSRHPVSFSALHHLADKYEMIDNKSFYARCHYWKNVYKDQEDLIRSRAIDRVLVLALPHLSGIECLTISDRYTGYAWPSHVWQSPESVPVRIYHELEDFQSAYLSVIRAFASTTCKLKELSIDPEGCDSPIIPISRLQLPLESLRWTEITFEHLTVAHFRPSLYYPSEVRAGIVTPILATATKLRRLSLAFSFRDTKHVRLSSIVGDNTWPCLEEVKLTWGGLAPADFCDFLHRHRNTLTTLILQRTRLEDNQWEVVANSIRQLPMLQDLLLEGFPVEGGRWLYCITNMETYKCLCSPQRKRHKVITDIGSILEVLSPAGISCRGMYLPTWKP